MKKLFLSFLTVGAVAGTAFAASNAFFSDTETSTGNILQAGALDLQIDNTCYYNGRACVNNKWQGTDEPCDCNWTLRDLDEQVFFSFRDLKPGDWEEDTISLHVDNPSWLCLDLKTTQDVDNTCTEPEQAAIGGENGACVAPAGDGELDDELFFVFWRDDGDNVFEEHELNSILDRGLAKDVLGDKRWALADSQHGPGPIPSGDTVFIGKFFCYGDIALDPVPDNNGVNPTVASGFKCDGAAVNNVSQTDLLVGDVTFYAEQHRNNPNFLCNPTPTPTAIPTPPVGP